MKTRFHLIAASALPALIAVAAVALLFVLLHGAPAMAQGGPDFSASYKTGPLYAPPGGVVTYTIVVVNDGAPAQGVALADDLPGGVTYISNSCSYDDGEGVWECGPLSHLWESNIRTGQRITTTLAVRVNVGTLFWPLVNRATLTWGGEQKEMVFTTTVMADLPDFSTSYKTGPQYAHPGDVITYTIVAVNSGAPAQGVVLSDTLPGGVVPVPGGCFYDDGAVKWACGPLEHLWTLNFPSGKRVTTTIAVTVVAGTLRQPLTNRARITWEYGRQDVAYTVTTADVFPDFTGSYKRGTAWAEVDGLVTYTIVAVNRGDAVTGVSLSDPVPTGLEFVSCRYESAVGSSGLSCTPPLLWDEDMPTGARLTTTLIFRVTGGTLQFPLRNCATLHWSDSWREVTKELCSTTILNPMSYLYLPVIARNMAPPPPHDSYEPNDTPSQAFGPLESGRVYKSYIWDDDDQDDYYYFVPASTAVVSVTLTNIPVGCDYDLYVYYESGGKYLIQAISNRGGNNDEFVTFTPVAGRSYYIRVYRYAGSDSENPYHLSVIYD